MSFIAKVRIAIGLPATPHPNETFRRRLRLRAVIAKKPRLIHHSAKFVTESQAEAFKAFVKFRGYDIGDSADATMVCFQRVSSMVGRRFDAETDALREEIEDLHGEYDGFGFASMQ